MKTAVLVSITCSAVLTAAITQPTFFARRDYPFTGFVAVGDVNGDGIPDLITINTPGIATLLGNGNGTFTAGPTTYVGPNQGNSDLVAIDLNGDGRVDLIMVTGAGIEVCLGNGDGTFQPAVSYGGGGGDYLAVGDFNNDGLPDVAVPSQDGIVLFTGKGGGVFSLGVLTPIHPTGTTHTAAIAAADFNKDGNLDLVVGFGYNMHPVQTGFIVLFGNGDGTFKESGIHPGNAPSGIAAADLNGDGYPDVVVGGASVYLNNGYGGFGSPTQFSLPGPQVAIGDLNGDGIPDLVSSLGYVAMGIGHGIFAAAKYYPVEGSLSSYNVVLAELRNNGLTDIVTGQNGAASVILNGGRSKAGKDLLRDGEWISVPGSGNCGAGADFNGDGIPDLAVPTSSGLVILWGTGKANEPYSTGATIPLSGPGCPITGDLNGDGIPDLLEGATSLGGVGVYLASKNGTFQLASVIPFAVATTMVLGDFNHDGNLDVATTSNQLALGNGNGTFQSPVSILASLPPPGYMVWLAAGDLNNDGWTDLVYVAGLDGEGIYVLVNNQQGGFTQTIIPDHLSGTAIMLADLNGDGKLDAVEASGDAYVDVYLGNGQGGFTVRQNRIQFPFVDQLPAQIGDVNGDGIPDLLLPADGSIGIALGKGTFLSPFIVGAGPGEGQIMLQNLHGQSPTLGLPDLVAPDSSGAVMVLLNQTKK